MPSTPRAPLGMTPPITSKVIQRLTCTSIGVATLGAFSRNQGERQVSGGAVWTVGGLAPAGNPIDDGHGHLLRSGTHARVFSTSFSTTKPDPADDLDKYQGRIASALDIDRVRKVLEFDQRATLPRSMPLYRAQAQASIKTMWTGSGWANGKENCGTNGQSYGIIQALTDYRKPETSHRHENTTGRTFQVR